MNSWIEQGCYEEIQNKLGYRLSLTSVKLNKEIQAGGILNLSVELINTGFSSLKNPRPLYLVLDGPERYNILLPTDPRLWSPSNTSLINLHLKLPAGIVSGNYKLAFWLPDGYDSLKEDSRFSVQFANDMIWDEENGYNVIGDIKINSTSIDESNQNNSTEFEIIYIN